MLKTNFYCVLFLSALFLNSSNVLCFSSLPSNDSSPPQQNLFPDIQHYNPSMEIGYNESTAIMQACHLEEENFLIVQNSDPENITAQPYNCSFNGYTNTFIPPVMSSGWEPNNYTATFNNNQTPVPITNDSEHANNGTNSNLEMDAVDNPMQIDNENNHNNGHTISTHVSTSSKKSKNSYTCNFCGKSFVSKEELKKHNKSHTEEKPYKCHVCDKKLKTKQSLAYHLRTHTGEKPFKCDICQKGFSSKKVLKDHQNKEKGVKPYKCTKCTMAYPSESGLNYHLTKEHKIDPKKKKSFNCTVCEKSFSKKDELNKHFKTHKKYTCSTCKIFSYKKEKLKEHPELHNQLNPFFCRCCGEDFMEKKNDFKHHLWFKDPDINKNRKCYTCKKGYANNYCLNRHNKDHHSKK